MIMAIAPQRAGNHPLEVWNLVHFQRDSYTLSRYCPENHENACFWPLLVLNFLIVNIITAQYQSLSY